MSSPSAAPRGIQSSCLTHSDKLFSCCPHSAGCSWTSALCLQEHFTSNGSSSLLRVHETYLEARNSIYVNSPASISQRAKSPMRTSPFTVHFCVSQFGLQLWFINRDEFPFGPASITRSYEVKTHVKTPEFKKARGGLSSPLSNVSVSLMLPWWGWACRSWSRDFRGHVWFAAGTPLSLSPLPHTLSQSHPEGNNKHTLISNVL